MKDRIKALVLMLTLVLLVSLSACSGEEGDYGLDTNIGEDVDRVDENSKEDTVENIMIDFKDLIDSQSKPTVIIGFINENIDKIGKENAGIMVLGLEKTLIDYTDVYTDEIFAEGYQGELIGLWEETVDFESLDSLFLDMENIIGKVENEGLKELLEKLVIEKYKLINMEGSFYPIIDYEALKEYSKYLDDGVKSYLDIRALDSNRPTILDAAIQIDIDELGERLIQIEDHLTKHGRGIKEEEILRLYSTYLKLYLGGADNTPIYDYNTRAIKEEFLNSYRKLVKDHGNITGSIVKKYINIIEENNNQVNDNVLSKIMEYHNEAIAKLEDL